MKNKIMVIVGSILFVAVMFFASTFVSKFSFNVDFDKNINLDVDNMYQSTNQIKVEEKDMEILEITSENFEEMVLKSENTVLIDFYADWCGPCKMMTPVVERIASDNSNLKVVKVNVDNEAEIAIKYGIMSIPTFVVIKNGEEVNRIVGAVDKAELENAIK